MTKYEINRLKYKIIDVEEQLHKELTLNAALPERDKTLESELISKWKELKAELDKNLNN